MGGSAHRFKRHLQRPLLIGTAVNADITRGKYPDITEIIKRNFSSITPENALKWESLRDKEGGWKWTDADNFVAFGQEHKIHSVGHCLAWHSQIPDSVFKMPRAAI